MLKEKERIDDLECGGLKIIQQKEGYTFTMDAVILANMTEASSREKVVELGAGSGVISILLSSKTKAKRIVGVEIQSRLAEMARRSVEMNNLQNKVEIVECDMKNAHSVLGFETFDVAVTNPPYMKYQGKKEEASEKDICKREVLITLEEVMASASRLLKFGGRLYVIIKGERLSDLIEAMLSSQIEPKEITPIQPTPEKDIDTIVVMGRKKGNKGMIFRKPLLIMDSNKELTERAKKFYNRENR